MAKNHESISPNSNSCQSNSWFIDSGGEVIEGKIKLENQLTDRGYNYLLKINIKNTRKRCKICSKLT